MGSSLITGPIRRAMSVKKRMERPEKAAKIEVVKEVEVNVEHEPPSSHSDKGATQAPLGNDLTSIATSQMKLKAERILDDDMPLNDLKQQLVKGPEYSQMTNGPRPYSVVVQGPAPFAPVYNATTRNSRSLRSVADGLRYDDRASRGRSVRGLASISEMVEKSIADEQPEQKSSPLVSSRITDVLQIPALDFSYIPPLSPLPSDSELAPVTKQSETSKAPSLTANVKSPPEQPEIGEDPSTAGQKRTDSKFLDDDAEDVPTNSTPAITATTNHTNKSATKPTSPRRHRHIPVTEPILNTAAAAASQARPYPTRKTPALIDQVIGTALPSAHPNEPSKPATLQETQLNIDSADTIASKNLSRTQNFVKRWRKRLASRREGKASGEGNVC